MTGFSQGGAARGRQLSTRQYARLVARWVAMIDLEPRAYGTHSLRLTKVARSSTRNRQPACLPAILGHRKLESTVRYLGIEVDDALDLSEQVDLWPVGKRTLPKAAMGREPSRTHGRKPDVRRHGRNVVFLERGQSPLLADFVEKGR